MLQKGWNCDYSILEKHGNQKIILSISPFLFWKKGGRTIEEGLHPGVWAQDWQHCMPGKTAKHWTNIQAQFSSLFLKSLLPGGRTQSEKANTTSAWAIPVLQINKGVNFLVLSDYCLFLYTRLFKNSQRKRRKIYCKAEFIYLPICKSWCINLWIQWIKLSFQGFLTGIKIEAFNELWVAQEWPLDSTRKYCYSSDLVQDLIANSVWQGPFLFCFSILEASRTQFQISSSKYNSKT